MKERERERKGESDTKRLCLKAAAAVLNKTPLKQKEGTLDLFIMYAQRTAFVNMAQCQ